MRQETIERIRIYSENRDRNQFHSPAKLANSIMIEAFDLFDCFHRSETSFSVDRVSEELADVLVYCRGMLDRLGLDEDEIVNRKMEYYESRYPA